MCLSFLFLNKIPRYWSYQYLYLVQRVMGGKRYQGIHSFNQKYCSFMHSSAKTCGSLTRHFVVAEGSGRATCPLMDGGSRNTEHGQNLEHFESRCSNKHILVCGFGWSDVIRWSATSRWHESTGSLFTDWAPRYARGIKIECVDEDVWPPLIMITMRTRNYMM